MDEKLESKFDVEYLSTSGVFKTPFTLIILVQLFLGGIILIFANLWFINSLYFLLTGNEFYSFNIQAEWYFWLLVPLNFFGNLFFFLFSFIFFFGGFFNF